MNPLVIYRLSRFYQSGGMSFLASIKRAVQNNWRSK